MLTISELNKEKQKVIQKLSLVVNNTKQSLELTNLDILYLLTDLGNKERKYMPSKMEDSLMNLVIRNRKIIFDNRKLIVLYKIVNNYKMNDDYNAILYTLLETNASIKNNIDKVKNVYLSYSEKDKLITESEFLLSMNYNQILEYINRKKVSYNE